MLYFSTGATESYSSWSVSIAAAAWVALLTHPSSGTFVYCRLILTHIHTHTSDRWQSSCGKRSTGKSTERILSVKSRVFSVTNSCSFHRSVVSQCCSIHYVGIFTSALALFTSMFVFLPLFVPVLIGFQFAVPRLSLGGFLFVWFL